MTIEREGKHRHVCELPAPNEWPLGTVAVCDKEGCKRRWEMVRVGWTFKGWHRTPFTFLADLFRGPGRCKWGNVPARPHDR